MVEVRAERPGRRLHNYAAHVLRVRDGKVTEWRMADAKPAESAAIGDKVLAQILPFAGAAAE